MIFHGAGEVAVEGAPQLLSLAEAAAVRRASLSLETFVPRLERDFCDLKVVDRGEVVATEARFSEKTIYLGGRRALARVFGQRAQAEDRPALLVFDAHLRPWLDLEVPSPCCWFLGARSYSQEDRRRARHQHRLLPLFEVELETAARTAVLETAERPLLVVVDLDVLEPMPGLDSVEPLGASSGQLWQALQKLPGQRVLSFAVVGLPRETGIAATLTARLVMDCSLAWWGM